MDTKDKGGKSAERAGRGNNVLGSRIFLYLLLTLAVLSVVIVNVVNAERLVASGGKAGKIIWVGLLSMLICAVIYFLSVWGYTACYSRVGRAMLVVLVVFCSLAVRLTIHIAYDKDISYASFGETLYSVLESIAFGGITPAEEFIVGTNFLDLFASLTYSWVPVYEALFIITVISFAIDYPMLCVIKSAFKKASTLSRRRKDVFIFDTISQETVLLAKDVAKKYARMTFIALMGEGIIYVTKYPAAFIMLCLCADKTKHEYVKKAAAIKSRWRAAKEKFMGEMNKRDALIFFYGKDIEGFDKKNNLHRELQSNNFIYLTYNHGKDMKMSKKYPREKNNADSIVYEWRKARRVHFFAFKSGENGVHSEDLNAACAFNEIAMLKTRLKYQKRRKIPEAVYFYVLSENDVDYPTYDLRLQTLAPNYKLFEKLPVELKIINEAERATWDMRLSNCAQSYKRECEDEQVKTARRIAAALSKTYKDMRKAFSAEGNDGRVLADLLDRAFSIKAADGKKPSLNEMIEKLAEVKAEKDKINAACENEAQSSAEVKAEKDKINAACENGAQSRAEKVKESFELLIGAAEKLKKAAEKLNGAATLQSYLLSEVGGVKTGGLFVEIEANSWESVKKFVASTGLTYDQVVNAKVKRKKDDAAPLQANLLSEVGEANKDGLFVEIEANSWVSVEKSTELTYDQVVNAKVKRKKVNKKGEKANEKGETDYETIRDDDGREIVKFSELLSSEMKAFLKAVDGFVYAAASYVYYVCGDKAFMVEKEVKKDTPCASEDAEKSKNVEKSAPCACENAEKAENSENDDESVPCADENGEKTENDKKAEKSASAEKPEEVEDSRVLCLGFGDTARKTIKALYANSMGNMVVDVLDKNLDNIIGSFKRNHPAVYINYLNEDCGDNKNLFPRKARIPDKDAKGQEVLNKSASTHVKQAHIDLYAYRELLTLQMRMEDCFDYGVAEYIDKVVLPTQVDVNYHAVIIALGDDERNIAFFRSMMTDMVRELLETDAEKFEKMKAAFGIGGKMRKLRIFVHLREKYNGYRLYWNEKRDAYLKFNIKGTEEAVNIADFVEVIPYGFKEDVFTYDEMINDAEAQEQSCQYEIKTTGNKDVDSNAIWFKSTIYNKWSSKVSKNMYSFYGRMHLEKQLSSAEEQETCEFFIHAAGLMEHRRWCRFMICNGFTSFSGVTTPYKNIDGEKDKDIQKDIKNRYLVHGDIKQYSLLYADRIYNEANYLAYENIWENFYSGKCDFVGTDKVYRVMSFAKLLEKGGIKPEKAIERFKAAAEKDGAARALKKSFDGCLPLIVSESEKEKLAAFEHCESLVGAVLSGYAEEADGQDDALSEERILTHVAECVYSRRDRHKIRNKIKKRPR